MLDFFEKISEDEFHAQSVNIHEKNAQEDHQRKLAYVTSLIAAVNLRMSCMCFGSAASSRPAFFA